MKSQTYPRSSTSSNERIRRSDRWNSHLLYILSAFLLLTSCAPTSLLEGTHWNELIFQKKSHGGAAALVGSELISPSFSLFADGRVVYYQYTRSGRRLVYSQMDRISFFALYNSLDHLLDLEDQDDELSRELTTNRLVQQAPVTEFYFRNRWRVFPGLGFYENTKFDSLQAFNRRIDQMTFAHSRIFEPDSILLFVKKIETQVSADDPQWNIKGIEPDKIYTRHVGYYTPNVIQNSRVIRGSLVHKVLKHIGKAGAYRKFRYKQYVFAIGVQMLITPF